MKLSDIPFDVGYHFDENLHEVPDDPEDMAKAIAFLLRARKRSEDAELLSIYGLLCVFCRIVGDLNEARTFGLETISLAQDLGNRQAYVQNQIRLATVYQWQGDFSLADAAFEALMAQCEVEDDVSHYLDFVLQHYGKSLFDQGRYREAIGLFERALDIREAGGNTELIASSHTALEAARARLTV